MTVLLAIMGVLLTIVGVTASVFSFYSTELRNNRRLRLGIGLSLIIISVYAGLVSIYAALSLATSNSSSSATPNSSLQTSISAMQPITVTQIVQITPTPDKDNISIEDTIGSVDIFNGMNDPQFQAGSGHLAILRNGTDVDYKFDYNLPPEGKGYARIVFFFEPMIDIAQYNNLEVKIIFSDPSSRCDINLRDTDGNSNYVRLGDRAFLGGIDVTSSTSNNAQTINIPLRINFKSVNQKTVKEIGFNANADFVRGMHSFTIADIRLIR